ncbi:MAG TPA: cytochrome P450 [Devosiaceae bacterium]|nr:cytochrome P450 [Devosiaceae bacterium]
MPRASVLDTLAVMSEVVLPTLAKGVIIRRRKIVGAAQHFGIDDRAVRRMQGLRRKYGAGPLMLTIPGRSMAMVLAAPDVNRILAGAPEPFAPASSEKRAALAHFEPKVALATRGPERPDRRTFNERTLEVDQPVHSMADALLQVVDEEAGHILRAAEKAGQLDWDVFFRGWYRMVRRLVLGSGARDDHELTDMLGALRKRGNWAFLRSRDEKSREDFHRRLAHHLQRAESGSLAARIAETPVTPDTAPTHQVAQWLFAFDPGGMATFRALALLSAHPDVMTRARSEMHDGSGEGRRQLPLLRASFLEALRLWATTPAILRESTAETTWESGTMPANTSIVVYAPFFHRDDEALDFAHRFTPDLWLDGRAGDWPLVPFSKGPAVCPAKNLVPMVASAMLAAIIAARDVELENPSLLQPLDRLPGTLDNYSLQFGLRPRTAAASPQ